MGSIPLWRLIDEMSLRFNFNLSGLWLTLLCPTDRIAQKCVGGDWFYASERKCLAGSSLSSSVQNNYTRWGLWSQQDYYHLPIFYEAYHERLEVTVYSFNTNELSFPNSPCLFLLFDQIGTFVSTIFMNETTPIHTIVGRVVREIGIGYSLLVRKENAVDL